MVSPTPKQTALMLLNNTLEVLYGGAAGGGKSEGALLMASQYVDIPHYSGLILRRTYRDLALPGALMDRSHQWWNPTDAMWDGAEHTWVFPSGARIAFGYMEKENDHLRYQSAEFQFVDFDELSQFSEHQYRYLFSRLRRLEGSDVPLRMRAQTNPGGPGHEWVKKRFDLPRGPGPDMPQRKFLPSTLDDNPHLDATQYERSLSELSELTRRQLRYGDWSIAAAGGRFDPADFRVITRDKLPPSAEFATVIRYWDTAASAPTDSDPDPDWTVGMKLGMTKRGTVNTDLPDFYILDIIRVRRDPGGTQQTIAETARKDGVGIPQWFEQERGGAGKLLIGTYQQTVLPGHMVYPLYVTGDKETRAILPSQIAREGRMFILDEMFREPFFDEISQFPIGAHDDQVDALSGATEACRRSRIMFDVGQARQY